MRRVVVVLVSCAMSVSGWSALAGPVPQTVAAGEDGTVLPIPRFVDIEADPVHGREFVTGGDSLVVTDVDGNVETTLDDLPRAAGMVMTPDYSTLYVALNGGDAIVAVDTVTLARTVFKTGADSCPKSLALASRMVWFVSACSLGREGDLHALDPATGSVSRSLTPAAGPSPEFLVSAPAARPHMLVTLADGTLTRLQVTGGASPTVRVAVTREVVSGGTREIALTPNGNRVIESGSASASHQVFDTRRLSSVDSYPSASYPVAVAVRSDGTVAAGTDDRAGYGDDVFVYAPGQTVVAARHHFGTDQSSGSVLPKDLGPRGLALGKTHVYALTVNESESLVTLRVLDDAAPATPPVGSRHIQSAGFSQILADPVHRRAFISGGSNGVFVVGAAGRVVKVLQHLPGATQMVLDRRRHTVYVALVSGSSIAAIDTRTLRVRKISTGPGSCPQSVAMADRLLWFTQSCYRSGDRLAAVNPRTGRVYKSVGGLGLNGGVLYGSVTHPRTLYTDEYHSTASDRAVRIRVSGGRRPTARVVNSALVGRSNQQTVLTPDGLHAIMVSPYLDGHQVVRRASMALAAMAPSDRMPAAAAVRSDGLVAKGTGLLDVNYVPGPRHEYAVTLARSVLARNLSYLYLPEPFQHTLVPRGMAFARKNLYTVNRFHGSGFLVTVHAMPPLHKLSVTTDRRVYRRGARVRAVAHLDASLPGRGRRVSIYSRPAGSARRVLLNRRAPNEAGNVNAAFRITRQTTVSVVVRTSRGTWRTSLIRTVT